MQRKTFTLVLIAISLLFLLAAGCTGTPPAKNNSTSSSAADQAYARGLAEYGAGNYRMAEKTFSESYALYSNASDPAGSKRARNAMFRAFRTYVEYTINASSAKAALRESVPSLTDLAMQAWLDTRAQKIVSENETLYFSVVSDYLSEHPPVRPKTEGQANSDPMTRWALSANRSESSSPFINPVRYEGIERLEIPHEYLPSAGTMRIWFPLPLVTESQRNISVSNLSFPQYQMKGPITTGTIAYVYYEIPAEMITGNLTVTAEIGFTSYEQLFRVDPAKVGTYNTSDPEYRACTASERNIEITDEIREKAREIVGNETNPYLQAQMIFDFVIHTYKYSFVPHISLDSRQPKIAESTYMFTTGHGDCGTQSALFSALCRSLGIPARPIGGYEMATPEPEGHFWAQYFVPGYGWIPADLTYAGYGTRIGLSDEARTTFLKYYGAGLDPARFVIQRGLDVPMDPAPSDDDTVMRVTLQGPKSTSDISDKDLDLIGAACFTVNLTSVNQ